MHGWLLIMITDIFLRDSLIGRVAIITDCTVRRYCRIRPMGLEDRQSLKASTQRIFPQHLLIDHSRHFLSEQRLSKKNSRIMSDSLETASNALLVNRVTLILNDHSIKSS